MSHPDPVLQLDVPARGGAQFDHRRGRKGKDLGVADAGEGLHGPPRDGAHPQVRPIALRPVLQLDETDSHVLALAGKAEAGHRDEFLNRLGLVVAEVLFNLFQDLLGALQGGARGQHRLHDEDALILVRQKGARQARI